METATHSMMYLICSHVLKTAKRDNTKQFFRRHMSHTYAKLEGQSRKIFIENLKRRVGQQTSCIYTFVKSHNNCCEASYKKAYHRCIAGKPYSNQELVKRCLMDVVKCIRLGKETDYSSIVRSHVFLCNADNVMSLSS